MALTQSALRLPGPSWDEEVVPALRKRLQSESMTLSKRMSAISLSGDDSDAGGHLASDLTNHSWSKPSAPPPHPYQQRQPNGSSSLDYSSSASANGTTQSAAKKPTQNGPSSPTSTDFQRSRTYSQPYLPDASTAMNRSALGSSSSSRPRPSDPKPTRIPKPSRTYASYSNGNTPVIPQTNGFATSEYAMEQPQQYEATGGTSSHQFTSTLTNRSIVGLAQNRSTSGLLNQSPPFPPSASLSSLGGYHHEEAPEEIEAAPSRDSMDSEEQPFEHWYRGEVSRNGGVGELRVGRRQEMLEIANYGHMIRMHHNVKGKASPTRWGQSAAPYRTLEENRPPSSGRGRHRKRADSIGGLPETNRVRGSMYFDEEGMNAVGRVLDESPLTDLDDDPTSDIASLSSFHPVDHDYILGVGDISTTSAATVVRSHTPSVISEEVEPAPGPGSRNTTPTPLSTQQTRNGQYPPSRIPGPRRSTDSRAGTPTLNNSTRSTNASTSSSSKTPSPPPIPSTGTRSVSGQSLSSGQPNGGRRGISPAAPTVKKRVPLKSLKGKQAPPMLAKKDPREVSQYPSPGDEDNMADAIPSWTQPVPREGNWDEVVLPVVARNKGLGEHYETADGSPQPKKPERIAPAPGTFGFNPSRYRSKQSDEFVPMDEFGRPEKPVDEESEEKTEQPNWQNSYNKHDQTRLPVRSSPPPSPPPFSHYLSQNPNAEVSNAPLPPPVIDQRPNDRIPDIEDSAGCCKCTVM